MDQLGKPYQWGAAGPGAYDCSGLVYAAYAAAGIHIARTTYQWQQDDPRVIELYEGGFTIASALADLGKDCDFGDLATRGRAESAVVRLLARHARPAD